MRASPNEGRWRLPARASAGGALLASLSACGGDPAVRPVTEVNETTSTVAAVEPEAAAEREQVSIYSPAAPRNVLWLRNDGITQALNACDTDQAFETVAVPLPDSIHQTGARDDRALHLPIVTTVDFEPAIAGTGPDWHPYPDAQTELRFVASLYEVGMGMMVFSDDIASFEDLRGKTIAVPRRPSSLRIMVEAMLRDGAGVLDDVELLDLPPNLVPEAVRDGRIQATTWNMIVEQADGYTSFLPPIEGRWLSVTGEMANRVSERNGFTTEAVTLPIEGEPTVLSLRQGLAAWSETPDDVVTGVLECLSSDRSPDVMADWPGLTASQTHPAATAFFEEAGR